MTAFLLIYIWVKASNFNHVANYSFTASKNTFFLYVAGDSYSENWFAKWEYLYTLARETPNSGTFSFIPVPAKATYSTWDFGILRITPSTYSDGQRQVHHSIHLPQVPYCF